MIPLEADFNDSHKIIFNDTLVPRIETCNSKPKEMFSSRRSKISFYLALSKKNISDVNKTHKEPMISICVGATNCFYRVAHPFVSLNLQYFGLNACYLIILFQLTQANMLFSANSQLFQEVVQLNIVAP